jgi:hypothetical protein
MSKRRAKRLDPIQDLQRAGARPVASTAADRVPASPKQQSSMVDEASEGSFPASDPPAYWAREA